MEKQNHDIINKVLTGLAVLGGSGASGYGSASLAIKYLEARVQKVEISVTQNRRDSEIRLNNLTEKVNKIGDDVSYIRGRMDGSKVK